MNPSDIDNQQENSEGQESFESDTQKIIHRHLQNKDDIITDDDIRNVRIGLTPPTPDTPALARFAEEGENDEEPKNNPVTPWDIVDADDSEG
jgi:hypothetical protein